ncbi:MAG TPA: hypothetical protein DCR14_19920, partial [Acidimicrobiaceae bacterium]|nr:hypothetical protein [Acidimicrobiaceae bacterium]
PSRGRASVAVAAGIVLAVATVGSGVVVKNAVAAAEDDEELECLDSVDNCDLPLDAVTLAGAHNAMSASPYPGWLFAEQTRTLRQQLNDGVRALLIDAHYGRRSSIVVPGARNRLVLTDVAAELAVPGSEVPDPLLRERAEELAATAPSSGAGARDVYLCHNFCELGAVRMADELVEVRRFLDENPGELVVIVVQNAVSAGDAQAAFEEAGLASRAAILEPGEPLPTVSELLYAGTPLLVFAERADPDAADWYMPMYEWFQETLYTWDSIDSFTCEPNRGDADNPFMLINHWVSRAPPDPGIARAANAEAVLLERFEECVADRGVRATIIAADFATSGDLVRTTRRLTEESAEALFAEAGEP